MSESITIEVPDATAREIALAAKAEGMTPADFIARAASQRARDWLDTETFFRARAAGADMDAFDRLMNRAGGEPPGPGDEIG